MITIPSLTTHAVLSDPELIDRASAGDRDAYGQLVVRHQAGACGVAYSVLGDLAGSEDTAQEAFVAAWKQLPQLADRSKFRSWVCGIARNLALLTLRRQRTPTSLDSVAEQIAAEPTPDQQAIQREEQQLVWQVLESLPGNYRDPLVLYYRDEQSVARVAAALDLSDAAVRQRLARGRAMIRAEVAAIVESTLVRSGPGKQFSLAVLAALPAIGATSAAAATIGGAAKSATPLAVGVIKAGALAGLWGSLIGLAGAGLGFWFSWKNARYERERQIYRRYGSIYLTMIGVFMLPLATLALGWWQPRDLGAGIYPFALLGWMTAFFAGTAIWAWRMIRAWKMIVAEEAAAGVAELPTSRQQRWLARWEGREWASRWSLLGLPLVHVNFSDAARMVQSSGSRAQRPRVARGWIAIGDYAYGVLLAVGSIAVGGVAVGGICIGGVAIGGLAIGGLCLAGVGAGGLVVSGVALGWLAVGGVAMGWHAVTGGVAIARHFAVGGSAVAHHANDAAARAVIDNSAFFQVADRLMLGSERWQHSVGLQLVVLAAAALLVLITWFVAYRRRSRG